MSSHDRPIGGHVPTPCCNYLDSHSPAYKCFSQVVKSPEDSASEWLPSSMQLGLRV